MPEWIQEEAVTHYLCSSISLLCKTPDEQQWIPKAQDHKAEDNRDIRQQGIILVDLQKMGQLRSTISLPTTQ